MSLKNMLTGCYYILCFIEFYIFLLYYRGHFDLTSPSIGSNSIESYGCPLCTKIFKSPPDLELHVNIEHRDILSPASSQPQSCPVCGISLDNVSKNIQCVY